MSTTFATPILSSKRNRHSVENDQQSALIKRINRLYAKGARFGCRASMRRKVRVVNGKLELFNLVDGSICPNFFQELTLESLWITMNSRY